MRSLPSDQTAVDTTAYEGEIQLVFSQVYLLMTLGLVITAVVAAWVSTSPTMLRLIYTNWWVPLGLFVVQIILVIALTAAISRLSTGVAVALFVAYAALLGVTLSAIFIVYTDASIATTFLVTGGTFGAMSIFGFVTKRDLTKTGQPDDHAADRVRVGQPVEHLPAQLGVVLDSHLCRHCDLRRPDCLRHAEDQADGSQRIGGRPHIAAVIVVMGALALYLDFINLFLLLLRIFGRSR